MAVKEVRKMDEWKEGRQERKKERWMEINKEKDKHGWKKERLMDGWTDG